MPDNTTPPADGQQGDPPADEGVAGGGTTTPPKPDAKTFTQAELDAIIADRVRRATPADYDDLKKKAGEYDSLQEGQKTELEKAQAKATKAEQERDAAIGRANATLVRAAILTEASSQSAVDADTVAALLGNDESVVVQADGSVAGAKEAVKALLKAKPFLVKAAGGGRSGGEFGGQDQVTIGEKITELERAGKFAEARALKIQQMAGLGS